MIVQEDAAEAVKPVRNLRTTLAWYGGLAVLMVAVVLTLLWGFVMVVLNAAPGYRVAQYLRRKIGLKSGLTGTPTSRSSSLGSDGSGGPGSGASGASGT
jgi:hypothetical protein